MLGIPGCATSGASASDVAALKEEVATLRRERQVDEKRLQVLENQFDAEQAELSTCAPRASWTTCPRRCAWFTCPPAAKISPALPTVVKVREPDEADLAQLDEMVGRGFPTAADSSNGSSGGGPDTLFDAAFEKLKTGDLLGAATDFQSFADRFPKNTAADNALLDEGIAMYGQHHYAEALKVLGRIEARYPAGDAVPEAIRRAADCEEKLGHAADARKRLVHLSKDFAGSPEGSGPRAPADPRARAGAAAPAETSSKPVADSHEGGSP